MLILVYGTDTYRMRRSVRDTVATYRGSGGSDMVFEADCAADGADEMLLRPLKYPSFFDDTKVIVAENAACAVMKDILADFDLPSMSDIVFIAVQDTSLKSCDKKVLTALQKRADIAEAFPVLTGPQRAAWATEYCRRLGVGIEPAALTALMARTGDDTRRLANELDKLAAYAGTGVIDRAAVDLLTASREERDVWELANALSAHDKRAAVLALWRKSQEGVAEPLLIGSVAAGIRSLLMIKDLRSRSHAPASIAKLTGLHPYVVSKSLRGADAADAERLTAAHLSLAALDRASKDGRADALDGLFATLVSL